MNVLFITNGYPSKKYVRNGIFAFDQAKSLVQAGHKVLCIGADLRSIRRWRTWGIVSKEMDGVDFLILNFPLGRVPKRISDKLMVIATKLLLKKAKTILGQPDIIHSHYLKNGNVLVDLFKQCNVPLVHTEHSSRMNKEKIEGYFHKLGNKVYKNVDQVVSVSTALAMNIQNNFGEKSIVIPNIVDTSLFNYYPLEKTNDEFSFISVGSLLEIKQMDVLIEAFSKAFTDNDKVKLYIYGNGPEKKALTKLIMKYNLHDQVLLMGEVNRSIIAKQMKRCDAFVLASKKETFGVALIEALASGLPAISTRCGGPEDIITKENGRLVEVGNVEELKESLIYMYKNHGNFNKNEISQHAKEMYSPKTIANRLTALYNEVLNR